MAQAIRLVLTGRQSASAELPALLQPAVRSAGDGAGVDAFLPPGYLVATRSFDVGPAARGGADGVAETAQALDPGEVIVLELEDGGVFVANAERLREALQLSHPELVGSDGQILIERLRAEGAARRGPLGDAVGGLIRKVCTVVVGATPDNAIVTEATSKLAELGVTNAALLGVSWLGTKALMWAIENRLEREPGRLYRWAGAEGRKEDLEPVDLVAQPPRDLERNPLLVFVHGTGSSTLGSFGELRSGERDLWGTLEQRYTGGIYAFEHRTLSESPIDNAIELVRALPPGARVSLVSHSRGGLVADLVCLGDFDALVDAYTYRYAGTGDAQAEEAARVKAELDGAHAEQRQRLRELAALLRERSLCVERYVRTASPANGTRLASANFDLFLSALLNLIGAVPFLYASPYYSAFKRVVVDIAKNRTNAHLVPGIEAMLPDSPMARLLRDAPVRAGIGMSVIAGDIEGGSLLQRLGVLLTDFLFFDDADNDLVVDTQAMLAGIAPQAAARVLFDRGADVSHFRYFVNFDTRSALRDWLTAGDVARLDAFRALPSAADFEAALAAATRDALVTDRPVVVVLPGVMGSHLWAHRSDHVWFEALDIAAGGLAKIEWGCDGVEARDLFASSYGEICVELAKTHRVERFSYDWRQPLDVLGERLGEFLDRLMGQTAQPIRLLAHSMGGLVVRACIYRRRAVMDALMARDGARLLMCGTPHQGAHSMVENLLGKGDTLRQLVCLDLKHDMQQVLDIVAGFRGALQLLPRTGFRDVFQAQPGGGEVHDYFDPATWSGFKGQVRDFWFGDGRCATPTREALVAAGWLWQQDNERGGTPGLPAAYEGKSVYVFGIARNTPCGVRDEGGRPKMVGTTLGDGTVTWASGRIGGIGSFYYLPAAHGDLLATREHFAALVDLLAGGVTTRLSTQPPALRAIEQPQPVTYDAGAPVVVDARGVEHALVGASSRRRTPPRARRCLDVSVRAMDLRFVTDPILVGHYEQDPIAGPESLIDRELLGGDLGQRYGLGLYAGARGSALVVLRAGNGAAAVRAAVRGAVVCGLGPYDGALGMGDLTEAVRTGAMRYLMQITDVLGRSEREVGLCALLLGYNSSANLSVAASVEALVRGVVEANQRFREATRLDIRIRRLEIVELYQDTAIAAVYALRQLDARLGALAARLGTTLVVRGELEQGEGMRRRLFDDRNLGYWPRLIVTDADRRDDAPARAGEMPRNCPEDGGAEGGVPGAPGTPAEPPTRIADRLRFLYLGQRARAESIVLQRQPGLVEQIVRQQIHVTAWQEDFGRMLFQLMVPHDFKEAARQLDRIVLVVDSYTANLPWELMLADDAERDGGDGKPLAVRTPVVRQLATSRYRGQVRQGLVRQALVVGNPSVEGFEQRFVAPGAAPLQAPPSLTGAEAEARAVARVLEGVGYGVEREIGSERRAIDVMAALYRRPYRIVHISAHGVFNLRHCDGRPRSGVVLSDGLLITAAEIDAMPSVPELVFLNCCHLGQIAVGRDGNKLAASLARELIDIGVRCVVAAGWAVNDANASLFGRTFYEALLLQRLPFGEAVFRARRAVWEQDPSDITWGAFQAYGDAGWRAEARIDGAAGADGAPYVSPDELLDDLARLRADLARRAQRLGERERRTLVRALEDKLNKRCPAGWLELGPVHSALGATWADLGLFARARRAYLEAVRAGDKAGGVPMRDVEQLINVEARLGEQRAEVEATAEMGREVEGEVGGEGGATASRSAESPLELIELALTRLDRLEGMVGAGCAAQAVAPLNVERSALRGSAFKRKAGVHARQALRAAEPSALVRGAVQAMREALAASARAYAAAAGSPGAARFDPYLALNRLALEASNADAVETTAASDSAALELARQCRQRAQDDFARQPDAWNATMPADALLVAHLLDGRLGRDDEAGHAAFDAVQRAYDEALRCYPLTPVQIDSLVTQLELLSRFFDARHLDGGLAAHRLVADRLLELVQRIDPGRAPRGDRPADGTAVGGTPPATAAG
ncbi:MAG TPA: CHAT domain-containing protein [Rubrivivax sp.]|nr:CHAT domain-containing protein [Rubrivivax sp.]